MKSLIRKLIPKFVLNWYHKAMAWLAAVFYGFPSEKLMVIGVTGTNGKSTTVSLIADIFEEAGYKVGATSTIEFRVADKKWLNKSKMTMLGRFQLQKLLKQMVTAGCQYAVIETSSQGIVQHRHEGINYDTVVFTNLTPEHIEAHGGFENYKKAKGELFRWITRKKRKKFGPNLIYKKIIANIDDEHADYFLGFKADKKYGFRINKTTSVAQQNQNNLPLNDVYVADNIKISSRGTSFQVKGMKINLKIIGKFNVYNALAAIAVCQSYKVPLEKCRQALEKIDIVPGRMEPIDLGQDFTVLIDYAPEPYALKALYETIDLIDKNKLIHVLGSCGGGRDVARRPVLGKMAGSKADIVIVTNEDPYDDDPMEIIDHVAEGALQKGKKINSNLFKILDRKEAICQAITMAQSNDLVLITGKGSEQAMVVKNNQKIPWDDREVAKQCLELRIKQKKD